jgi:hypothetical protein
MELLLYAIHEPLKEISQTVKNKRCRFVDGGARLPSLDLYRKIICWKHAGRGQAGTKFPCILLIMLIIYSECSTTSALHPSIYIYWGNLVFIATKLQAG